MNLPGFQERLDLMGRRLRALRRARGLSMRMADQVRNRYGVRLDPSYLSRVERGRAALPMRTLFALADYFGVEPTALFSAEESPGASPLSSTAVSAHPLEFQQAQELLRFALALVVGRGESAGSAE